MTYPQATLLPATLAEVALVSAEIAAATGGMSQSWWSEQVRTGAAPRPVIQLPRFSRWRATDVAEFWRDLAAAGKHQSGITVAVASHASAAARVARGTGIAKGSQP